MKRILFCSFFQRTKEQGGSKVVMELVEEMQRDGWDCQVLCPQDIAKANDSNVQARFPENLRHYLIHHAAEYDVVDYDHTCLPYKRSDFSLQTLMVARSVILAHHLETIPIPSPPGVKAALGRLLKDRQRRQWRRDAICRAQMTVEEADLVNVSNEDDKKELLRRGISDDKIIVLPYGISRIRRPVFDQIQSELPSKPVVAFVGTFDYRKGAREFPKIVGEVVMAVPDVRFKLMGTKGLFQSEAEVRAHFPQRLQKHLEVVPSYKSEELPRMLADCSVGMFPSYMEGFPFGVLEMLAASVPVIAYNAPGPPMMLPTEYLVERNDTATMSSKIATLLQDHGSLTRARVWAKQQSQQFDWRVIARATGEMYQEAWQSR